MLGVHSNEEAPQHVPLPAENLGAALAVWRNSLVNLNRTNRLLNFKHSKSGSLAVTAPAGAQILDGLRAGRQWSFEGAPTGGSTEGDEATTEAALAAVPSQGRNVLRTATPDKDLGPVLRNLLRRSRREYLDRGLSVLYTTIGMLEWEEPDGTGLVSPLLLIPCSLISTGARGVPRMEMGDDDPVVNPALALRLQEFGVTLPTVDDLTELVLADLYADVRARVRRQASWNVTDQAVLACFSFHKEAMYRDLLDNEEQVLAHPAVRALATNPDTTAQSDVFFFEEITPDRIDEDAPPEDTPLVLDADSSQRACVAAAVDGRSFVMDGPPGTGKSQTIANMIGALLHAGRTVLFVSEKIAALDVVRNRLADAGLESYLLELHSHKSSRKEVAAALAEALDGIPVPPPGMTGISRNTLIERRRQLNSYAEAMNQPRRPLGSSLHQILGLLAALDHIPAAPTPTVPPATLTPEMLNEIRDAALRLSRAWRPAEQGRSYLWRHVTQTTPMDAVLYQAMTALEELHGTVAINHGLAAAFGVDRPSRTPVLIRLITLAHTRPARVPQAWLTSDDLSTVHRSVAELSADLDQVRITADRVVTEVGQPWRTLPDPETLPAVEELPSLTPPSASRRGDLNAAAATELADRFQADAALLESGLSTLGGLTGLLRLPAVVTMGDAENVLTLTELAYATHRPEAGWVSQHGVEQVRTAAAVLQNRLTRAADAAAAARRYYTDAAFNSPVAALHHRFTDVHRGLNKLLGEYRRDKRAVEAFTAEGVPIAEAVHHLETAVTWQQANIDLSAAVSEHAGSLGGYWAGVNTDFDAIHAALAVTEEILRRTPSQALNAVTGHVCASDPHEELHDLGVTTRQNLTEWALRLAPPPLPAAHPDLLSGPLADAAAWQRIQVPPLRAMAFTTRAVSRVAERSLTYATATDLLTLRAAASDAEETLDAHAASYRRILEDLFHGYDTDEKALGAAVGWVADARRLATEVDRPLTSTQAATLDDAQITEGLPDAYTRWDRARRDMLEAFDDIRREDLSSELDDFLSAAGLLADLRTDAAGHDEWFAYAGARADLKRHNLDVTVDFAIHQGLDAAQVPQVIDRALLRAWADHIIGGDAALHPLRAEDRTALVTEYRSLDEQLIPAATSDIIRAVNMRRPAATDIGDGAVIRREGMKKTRHLPVRQLIGRTRRVAQTIKPCFMMSPLAVSQYLPPDMTFDVVIFDEASQVTPGDAINCIYRARALITAGDDRQLPPTSFFDRMTDAAEEEATATDVNDFQSILELSKASGAFRNLGLSWHYRSRHEDLIAFSNRVFYDGRLITYPGAHSHGPDIGVELFTVHGSYRRGTSRDNPIEAEKVAERVLHHFSTRPGASLGVVTFSVAQADAIEAALDRAREARPDLESHFDDDRLRGFFVKSLESVQGDERDVMIFSIGYGPDEHGKITSNFGALNKPKGWRRLNVAITRARERVEIVSSVRAGDIPTTDNQSVRYLAAYLDFAERGVAAFGLDIGPTGRDAESPFEESVISVIRGWGFNVEPQVGAAGYRIDIGVRHAAHPGVFALGVECDGAMYHSSPAARDRDRLRGQVLTGLGWDLHRIWGTAWYRNRAQEEDRLLAAITQAMNAPARGRLTEANPVARPTILTTEVDRTAAPTWTTPYTATVVTPLPRWIDPSDRGSRFNMAAGIKEIAAAEGPVHIDQIFTRLRQAWKIGRIGPRIRENIEAAINLADVHRNGPFIDIPNRAVSTVRTPTDGIIRAVEQVTDQELDIAIANLVRDAGTVAQDDLTAVAARLYGWTRRTAEITSRLDDTVDRLHTVGALAGPRHALAYEAPPAAEAAGAAPSC